MINLTLTNKLEITNYDNRILAFIKSICTHVNSKYYLLLRMKKHWAANKEDEFIKTYEVKNNTLCIDIGLLNDVVVLLNEGKYTYKIIDKRVTEVLDYEYKTNIKLRELQNNAVAKLLSKTNGILDAACSAGKTIITLKLIEELNQRTLILVHEYKLLEQWKERLLENTNLNEKEIGLYTANKKNVKPITLATVQTFTKYVDKFKDYFGCVVLDEGHMAPATTFGNIISKMNSKYKYCLTGSLERSDNKTFLTKELFGEVLFKITDNELLKAGSIIMPNVYFVKTNYRYDVDVDKKNYVKFVNALSENKKRNELIIKHIHATAKNKKFVVFTNRREHCDLISKELNKLNFKTITLMGGDKNYSFKDLNNKLERNELDGIVATTSDKGMDIPVLDVGYQLVPCSDLRQRIGRIKRKNQGKLNAEFYYFYDSLVSSEIKKLGMCLKYFPKTTIIDAK